MGHGRWALDANADGGGVKGFVGSTACFAVSWYDLLFTGSSGARATQTSPFLFHLHTLGKECQTIANVLTLPQSHSVEQLPDSQG